AGDLGLREPLEVGQLDDPALLGRQRGQRCSDAGALLALRSRLEGERLRIPLRFGRHGSCSLVRAPALAQPIDGTAAGHRSDPGGGRSALGAVLGGAAPDLHERVLHDLLRLLRGSQDKQRDRHRPPRDPVVERAERAAVAAGDEPDQLLCARSAGGDDEQDPERGHHVDDPPLESVPQPETGAPSERRSRLGYPKNAGEKAFGSSASPNDLPSISTGCASSLVWFSTRSRANAVSWATWSLPQADKQAAQRR